ncbi:ABC transporter substrate-binding protein [Bosea sp. (in: a-proteobacteria)]|jgi:NitT/TauT family transport system substrate-binding protein|uniref:ABC transporter substrate-binding protein n=1 Tax=Bosea sp. (in: a-proteobacteria) TaxID=1871050 RepID=UPI002DDDA900|nr:ABC transporter substrate-binding protein [Bosea sp. (in: a-proteobacteria)]HEV2511589.1 ABC transporter substrate-binding protein [Bosea sp. (in: a-proteobacteria)]
MSDNNPLLSRRTLIAGGSALALGAPIAAGFGSAPSLAQGGPHKLKLGWSGTGICLISVPAAAEKGFFTKHGLDVEIVKFGSNFDGSLEAVASGKIDATVNFILRFLKPLEQGINIRFTGALHGGCIRVISGVGSQEVDYKSLKGKSIGVVDMASAGKNFLAVQLFKAGINPANEVDWRVYPVDLLGEAIKKGEIQAAVDADPGIFLVLKNNEGKLHEIGGLLTTDPYKDLSCCGIAVRKDFAENNKPASAALTRALLEAADWVKNNPDEAAQIFSAYSPIAKPILGEIIRSHTHEHHFGSGKRLREEVALYADDLRSVGVIRPRTDPKALAERITVDVLG